jgi:thioredoxin 1
MRLVLAFVFALALACAAKAETTVLWFTAERCGVCREMAPVVRDLKRDGYVVVAIDVDREPALSKRYGVTRLPMFVVVESGKIIDTIVGRCTLARLKEHLKKHWFSDVCEWEEDAVRSGKPRALPAAPKCQYPALVAVDFFGTRLECGTGFVADRDERTKTAVVVTCAHGLSGDCRVEVRTQDDQRLAAKIVAVNVPEDLCVLLVADPGVEPMVVSRRLPVAGARLYCAGFAHRTAYMGTWGKFNGFVTSGKVSGGFVEATCRAEQGCSGGPILDESGEVVATLTGSNDASVIGPCLSKTLGALECGALYPSVSGKTTFRFLTESFLPWRQGQEAENKRLQGEIDAGRGAGPAPCAPGVPCPSCPAPAAPVAPEERPGNRLEQKLDDFLRNLPVQGAVARVAEKQLESEHPLQRFFGASTAIVLITVFGGLLLVGMLLLGHKVYQAAHAHKTQIDTALGNLPVGGAQLQTAFDKLDAFNTANVDPKIADAIAAVKAELAAVKAKAESALHVGTAAAVAAVPGGAVPAALSAVVSAAKTVV